MAPMIAASFSQFTKTIIDLTVVNDYNEAPLGLVALWRSDDMMIPINDGVIYEEDKKDLLDYASKEDLDAFRKAIIDDFKSGFKNKLDFIELLNSF